MTKPVAKRCAIYTRKSSEEGLDQAFNSLDAQREAGEAYVLSQASEGWKPVATRYDDGGYSGGSMERPALQRLLADVEAGRIDIVVVYKIDRLTRSLADFARIVERFDAQGVSFVSVTQAFNTTSSMGRLTLNVLLSFAQFEREVTGERIRDKIAASKARGMWMGGIPPLGYDMPEPGSRTLRINEAEAATVRFIFERYLEVGSVHRLVTLLAADRITSKRHITATGKVMGGVPFGRGALFHLLRNRTYLGEIVHKELSYPGEHEGIVPRDLFERVQQRLNLTPRREQARAVTVDRASLVGKVFDASGEPMSPTHSRGRSGRVYRYYVSASLQRGEAARTILQRVSAPTLESTVASAVERLLPNKGARQLKAVHVHAAALQLVLGGTTARLVQHHLEEGETAEQQGGECVVTIPLQLQLRGGKRSVTSGARDNAKPDPKLIAALRKARALIVQDARGMPIISAAPPSPYERRLMRLGLLAPDIQRDILAGRQPPALNLERLIHGEVPIAWSAQRAALGFAPRH